MSNKNKIVIILILAVTIFVIDFIFLGPITNSLIKIGTNFLLKKETIKWEIIDMNNPIIDTVKISLDASNWIYKLEVLAKGQLSDSVILNHTKLFPGRVDTIIYYGDWYQKDYVVNYKPKSEVNGNLKLEFTFYYNK